MAGAAENDGRWARRRARRAAVAATREALLADHVRLLEEGDPDAVEAANQEAWRDASRWREGGP